MSAALVACSSGSSSNNNPPPPTTTIAATSGSSQSATTGTAFANPLVATVTNGGSPVSGASVTFTAPASGASGTFTGGATDTETTDANGKATSTAFTANSTAGTYSVTATVSGASAPASFSLTNTAPTGPVLADGTYVFQLSGTYGKGLSASPATPSPYFVAGAFVVSGGVITGGEQDLVDVANNYHDAINGTGSTITSVNGNIQIVLTTCNGGATNCASTDTFVGVAGVETLRASMGSATSGRIIEFDTAATASGTIDLQDPTAAQAAPTGGYIFGVQGWSAGNNPLAITGLLNVSGTSISTTGTVFDLENNGNPFQAQTITAGTVSGPNASGRVIFGFTPSNTSFATINLVGYVVDGTRIRIVEGHDTFFATLGGTAYAQNAASLGVSGNSYVFGMRGADANGALQAAGVLTLGSTGNVSGTISYNDLSSTVLQPAGPVTAGTYLADAANPGRVTLTGVTDGVKTFTIELYVDGNGNALAMTLDTGLDIMQGVAYQQTSGATFSGAYAMNATGNDVSNSEFELDAVGSITTGSGTFASTASTGVDLNWISGSSGTVAVPAANLPVSGAFTAPSGGVSSGAGNTITGIDVTAAGNSDAFTYYVVDANRVVAIETDLNQLSLVFFEK
jgi:hypothetical protein